MEKNTVVDLKVISADGKTLKTITKDKPRERFHSLMTATRPAGKALENAAAMVKGLDASLAETGFNRSNMVATMSDGTVITVGYAELVNRVHSLIAGKGTPLDELDGWRKMNPNPATFKYPDNHVGKGRKKSGVSDIFED